MSKILIAIASCGRDTLNGFNDAIRETWLSNTTVDYKFFIGRGATPKKDDEILLDCPDHYIGLPYKTLEIVRWALNNNYDYIFKCDTDTFVMVDRLLQSGFEQYDYVGAFNEAIGIENAVYGKLYSWASGGSGYFISKKAGEIVLATGINDNAICPKLRIPCEDLWMGQVLGPYIKKSQIAAFNDTRLGKSFNPNFVTEISSHYCSEGMKRKFDISWMLKHYEVNNIK